MCYSSDKFSYTKKKLEECTRSAFKWAIDLSATEVTGWFQVLYAWLYEVSNLSRILPLLFPGSSPGISFWLWSEVRIDENLSFLSFSKRAAEEEKTDAVLESERGRPIPFWRSVVVEEGRGQTEVGTSTTENIRWAPIRVLWSGWTIACSNWWNKDSGKACNKKSNKSAVLSELI